MHLQEYVVSAAVRRYFSWPPAVTFTRIHNRNGDTFLQIIESSVSSGIFEALKREDAAIGVFQLDEH
jgi:hypothetical protein